MPPIVSQSTTNIYESSTVTIGGSVAARIARQTPNPSSSSSGQDDGFGEYRNLCEMRIRRLERYKKAKSFCSLDSDDSMNYGNLTTSSTSSTNIAMHSASSSTCSTVSSSSSLSPSSSNQQLSINTRPVSTTGQSIFESQVELLKQKMISLMRDDVMLLQKLVALGETIQELKTTPQNKPQPAATRTYRPRSLPRTNSETSLSSSYGEEDDDWKPLEGGETFSQSMSAITRLYVENGDAAAADEEEDIKPNIQYFSRKNSVLRIPIPPRSSNRMLGNKRVIRRPSQLLRQCPKNLLSSEDSGHSSSSDSTTPPLQPSPKGISDGTSTVSSSASSTSSSFSSSSSSRHPLYDIQECGGIAKTSRRSNTSVDSGISGNSSPTFVTNLKMMG